jgi:hypothetical protein
MAHPFSSCRVSVTLMTTPLKTQSTTALLLLVKAALRTRNVSAPPIKTSDALKRLFFHRAGPEKVKRKTQEEIFFTIFDQI